MSKVKEGLNSLEEENKKLKNRIAELENQSLSEAIIGDELNFSWAKCLGFWTLDVKTKIMTYSLKRALSLGYEESELKGDLDFLKTLLLPQDSEHYFSVLEDYLKDGKGSYENEYRILSKNSDILWFYEKGKVLEYDDFNKPAKIKGLLFDISVQKKSESEFLEAKEELEKSNIAKDKLFSMIAHDLRNPLLVISGYSELLLEKGVVLENEDVSHYASLIGSSVGRISELLEELLQWVAISKNLLIPKKDEFNLLLAVKDELNVLSVAYDKKNINLVNEVAGNIFVFSDENFFKTVFRNLVSNAVKFTPENGKIEIFAEVEDDKVWVTVRDSGVGMDKETLSKLFVLRSERPQRGTNQEKGIGLGLLVCKDLIRLLEQEIHVSSELEKGSEFSFSLQKA